MPDSSHVFHMWGWWRRSFRLGLVLALLLSAGCGASTPPTSSVPTNRPASVTASFALPTATVRPTIAQAPSAILTTTPRAMTDTTTAATPSTAPTSASSLSAVTAPPTAGGSVGERLVFRSNHEGNADLYLVHADG